MIDFTRVDIKEYLEQNPSCIYERCQDDEIPLIRLMKIKGLSSSKKIHIMKLFLRAGVDFNWSSPHNRATVLMWACRLVDIRCVEYLLDNGADPNQPDHEGNSSLFWSCDTEEPDSLKIIELILKRSVGINSKNKSGSTPLIWSSQKDNVDLTKYLIENGADINSRDSEGNTPLIWACKNGCKQVPYILLKHGAKVNKKNNVGNNALMWACIKGDIKLVNTLLTKKIHINSSNKAGWSPLMWASKSGHEIIVKSLLQSGADVNAVNQLKETALMWATHQQHITCVQLLLAAGSSLHLRNSVSEDALLYACKRGNNDLILLLISHGANPLLSDSKGLSALKLFFQVKNMDILRYLCNSDSFSVNTPLQTGEYPLTLAVQSRSLPIVQLLVQHHADLNKKDSIGKVLPTIMNAYKSGNRDIALFLAEKGTDMRNHIDLQQLDSQLYSRLVRTWNWGRRKNFLLFLKECGFLDNSYLPLSHPIRLRVFNCFDLCRVMISYL